MYTKQYVFDDMIDQTDSYPVENSPVKISHSKLKGNSAVHFLVVLSVALKYHATSQKNVVSFHHLKKYSDIPFRLYGDHMKPNAQSLVQSVT